MFLPRSLNYPPSRIVTLVATTLDTHPYPQTCTLICHNAKVSCNLYTHAQTYGYQRCTLVTTKNVCGTGSEIPTGSTPHTWKTLLPTESESPCCCPTPSRDARPTEAGLPQDAICDCRLCPVDLRQARQDWQSEGDRARLCAASRVQNPDLSLLKEQTSLTRREVTR